VGGDGNFRSGILSASKFLEGTVMLQDTVWLISLILMTAIAVVFLWVAAGARRKADAEAVQRRAYRLRAGWFWLLIVVIAVASVTTLRALPYPDSQPQAASRVIVRATGAQWAWTIEGPDLVVGKPVEFQVTSTDVNHGFGIYNPTMEMMAQTQAMPGYVNRLRLTFIEPGTYHILCLEYCGLVHHQMMTDLVVKPD
jgi:cytochrome c oxidase subunit II